MERGWQVRLEAQVYVHKASSAYRRKFYDDCLPYGSAAWFPLMASRRRHSLPLHCSCHTSVFDDIGRREGCEERFGLANLYAARMIEIQCDGGRSPDRGLPNDAITVPTKMCIPVVYAWVKQLNQGASLKIDACNAVGLNCSSDTPRRDCRAALVHRETVG